MVPDHTAPESPEFFDSFLLANYPRRRRPPEPVVLIVEVDGHTERTVDLTAPRYTLKSKSVLLRIRSHHRLGGAPCRLNRVFSLILCLVNR